MRLALTISMLQTLKMWLLHHKVGIADDGKEAGLKVELLNEKRTSSFSVEPDNTPLYRRFNNEIVR